MAAEFLARTKVSFVKTAVLSSNDGGNTFNEETTIKNKTDEQGNAITAEEMKRIEKMNKKRSTGTNLSLYEQLEKNKAEKDELWKAKHGPQAPKGLDEEDILFLNEHSIKQAQKRRDIVEAEESELAIFRNAQRQKSNNGAITSLNSNNNNNKSEANFKNANINDTNNLKRKSKLPSNLLKKRQKKIVKQIMDNDDSIRNKNNNNNNNKSTTTKITTDETSSKISNKPNVSALDFLNELGDDSSSDDDSD